MFSGHYSLPSTFHIHAITKKNLHHIAFILIYSWIWERRSKMILVGFLNRHPNYSMINCCTCICIEFLSKKYPMTSTSTCFKILVNQCVFKQDKIVKNINFGLSHPNLLTLSPLKMLGITYCKISMVNRFMYCRLPI